MAPVFCFFFADPFVSGSCVDKKQNQCVRLFKDESIKKNKHVLVITVQISTGNHGKAAKKTKSALGRCWSRGWFTFRLEERLPVTVKKESSRPCVLPCRLFRIFLQPFRILSSLQTESKRGALLFIHELRCWFRAAALPPNGQTYVRQAVRN